jgi:hypothetical protein
MIKDSGKRREFSTGAVRDIGEQKGRCDLLPLRVVAKHLVSPMEIQYNAVLYHIDMFMESQNTKFLHEALTHFAIQHYHSSPETMLLEVSKHFEEGATKYGENNWQKGLPVNCYIDSAVRHYLKHRRGDTDEPHDRAFVWNILCCIWEVDYHHDR